MRVLLLLYLVLAVFISHNGVHAGLDNVVRKAWNGCKDFVKGCFVGTKKTSTFPPSHFAPSDFFANQPMRAINVTVLTVGSRGDVQPYIALCKGMMHIDPRINCRIATHAGYETWVRSQGVEFRALPGEVDFITDAMNGLGANGVFSPYTFERFANRQMAQFFRQLLNGAWQACLGSDILLAVPFSFAGPHIAEKLRIPFIEVLPFPATPTRELKSQIMEALPTFGSGRLNRFSHFAPDFFFGVFVRPIINEWRVQELGLAPLTIPAFQTRFHSSPVIYGFSPSLLPKPKDWSCHVHVTGQWVLPNPEGEFWQFPPDLQTFLTTHKGNLVYIGFGSVQGVDPLALLKTTYAALKETGLRAVVSKWWIKDQVKTVERWIKWRKHFKDYVFVVEKVPHDKLFPLMKAAVHHGGAGTTHTSLLHGVPTLIKPFFADQHLWCQQVFSLKVGACLPKKLTAKTLVNALFAVTTNPIYKAKAMEMRMKLQNEDGVMTAYKALMKEANFVVSTGEGYPGQEYRRGEQCEPTRTVWREWSEVEEMNRSEDMNRNGADDGVARMWELPSSVDEDVLDGAATEVDRRAEMWRPLLGFREQFDDDLENDLHGGIMDVSGRNMNEESEVRGRKRKRLAGSTSKD